MVKRVVYGVLVLDALFWCLVWVGAKNGEETHFVRSVILGTLATLAYFAPSLVADGRKHKSAGGIVVVNFFLGWTALGWIVALAWAYSDSGRKQPSIAPAE